MHKSVFALRVANGKLKVKYENIKIVNNILTYFAYKPLKKENIEQNDELGEEI